MVVRLAVMVWMLVISLRVAKARRGASTSFSSREAKVKCEWAVASTAWMIFSQGPRKTLCRSSSACRHSRTDQRLRTPARTAHLGS